VPEFGDPVFAKASPKRSFSVIENERFGLVFAKTGSINSGTRYGHPGAKFLVPYLGNKADYGIGLSYRPARLYW